MLEKFESEYESNEIEITVLLKSDCNGAVFLDKKWLKPSVTFVACIYGDRDEVVKEEGRIEWLIEDKAGRTGWGYDFKQYGIYRLKVRKCIKKQLMPYQMEIMNNRYRLVQVLEEDVKNDQLINIKEYLMKPVTIETPYCEFELDRSMSWFEAETEIDGFEFSVMLETDEENEDTAEGALKTFLKIAENFTEFDKKNKEDAANFLLELANEWLDSDDGEDKPEEITKEMFIDAIEISEMTIAPDGSMTLYYYDGDMFWGHVIEMEIEADGTCSDAHIAG